MKPKNCEQRSHDRTHVKKPKILPGVWYMLSIYYRISELKSQTWNNLAIDLFNNFDYTFEGGGGCVGYSKLFRNEFTQEVAAQKRCRLIVWIWI